MDEEQDKADPSRQARADARRPGDRAEADVLRPGDRAEADVLRPGDRAEPDVPRLGDRAEADVLRSGDQAEADVACAGDHPGGDTPHPVPDGPDGPDGPSAPGAPGVPGGGPGDAHVPTGGPEGAWVPPGGQGPVGGVAAQGEWPQAAESWTERWREGYPPEAEPSAVVTGAAYGMLFVLGAVYGVVSGLQHSWGIGDLVPPVPIVLSLILFGLLYGAGRLMGTKLSAFVTGMGWMLIALVFAIKQPEGDLIVAATPAGYWYLGGGAIALVVAVLMIPSPGSWLLRPGPFGGGNARPMNISDGMSA
ncbi:DUF6113 family protein [Sphaerisporangium sp. NPDC005289]|uniref:DUF6113 family protein n=1 Tax=Sphaerisporangium sp. NPDC005289 TaxID=3155247 RepID=UPI0033BED2D2